MRCAVFAAIHGHSPLFADVPVARLSRRKQGFESPRERACSCLEPRDSTLSKAHDRRASGTCFTSPEGEDHEQREYEISLGPSSLLKKVFEVSLWATLIQDPSARRTKDSQPSGFGFEYCASHVRFRVFQQTARPRSAFSLTNPPFNDQRRSVPSSSPRVPSIELTNLSRSKRLLKPPYGTRRNLKPAIPTLQPTGPPIREMLSHTSPRRSAMRVYLGLRSISGAT